MINIHAVFAYARNVGTAMFFFVHDNDDNDDEDDRLLVTGLISCMNRANKPQGTDARVFCI